MTTIRQGTGIEKVITATGPDARTDGAPLGRSEVDHFEFDLSFAGGLTIDAMQVQLSDDPGTPEWDGSFSESLMIDDLAPGTHTITYRTVDKGGRMSANSAPYILEVLPPLANPNPPTNLA